MLLQIIVIAISLSIDALGIGIAYPLRGVRIGGVAKGIIGLISCMVMYLSIFAGTRMNEIIPNDVMLIIGTGILILMGVIYIRNSLFSDEEANYDFDRSKKIELFEAVILGFALSADSISAGIAIVAIGIDATMIPIVVGVMQVSLLTLGNLLITRCSRVRNINSKVCGVFSGVLLIIIAIMRSI
ncbi:MAG TPA: manganese efflux pump [Lachnospiraceae bacterium]|nr:manganese efflux pump [Lachnospiraceae bacterium]